MALEKETIIANETLKDLSEEQIAAVITLSANSENELFRQKMGEHYRQLDASIEEHSGIERNGDEKTYDYLPRAIDAMKTKYNGDIASLKTENESLKAEIAKGGDAALKAQLESVQRELTSTKDQFNALKSEYDKAEESHKGELVAFRIDNEIARALEGIKFKAGLNEAALTTLKNQAVANLKMKSPSFEVRGGEERLIFHDENGSPLNNAENKLNPFTSKELLIKEFEAMEILDKKPGKGAGGAEEHPEHLDIVGASTQTEATTIITKELLSKGLTKGSAKFQEEFNKVWGENNISKLPLR